MPRTIVRPQDGRPSASVAAAAAAAQMQNQKYNPHDHDHDHDHDCIIPPVALPSLILTALFIRQVFDTSALLRTVELFSHRYCMNATTFYCGLIDWLLSQLLGQDGHLAMLILQSSATFSAFAWLLYRAYRTLRTPVSKLIDTLGVEVPDVPLVTLAGLKSNACTIQWSRPGPGTHRPVAKYLIQVNGVNVGESSRLETTIEVTGLKPGHFYNVRVIAVGGNHFQAGSKVLRLSTLRRDGTPQRGHGSPSSTKDGAGDDQDSESNDETQAGPGHSVEIQATTLPDSAQNPIRDQSSGGYFGAGGQRRNTGGRKRSPSTAAADQAARERAIANLPEDSMQKLTEKFETTRRETEEVMAAIARDFEDHNLQHARSVKERDEQRQKLKDREEQSEKLKKDANNSERMNRLAQNKKSQKEKVLKDKKAERDKMRDDMARWKKEIESMRNEKELWRGEKEKVRKAKEDEVSEIQKQTAEQQSILEGLEKDIHNRGRQIRDLEVERMKLPGSEDEEQSQARDAADRKDEADWETVERALVSRLNGNSQRLRDIEIMISQQQTLLTALEAAHRASQPIMFHGNSSSVDFDPTGGQNKAKPRRTRNRRSRTSTISSPISAHPIADSQYPSASAYNNLGNASSPAFAPPPYIQMNNDTGMVIQVDHTSNMSEDEIRMLTAGAPLSPTAASLLPSNIFADDHDELEGRAPPPPFGHAMYGNIGESFARDRDPQSPDSSSRSASLISSPRDSSHNLALYGVPIHDHYPDGERRSVTSPLGGFGTMGSPSTATTAHKGFMNLFSGIRGKNIQEDGPILGSLKHGQSQSFPRSSDEPESLVTKSRRISLSSASWGGIFKGSPSSESIAQGNAPAPARNPGARNRRGFALFPTNSADEPSHRSERDPSSPRPLSVASSDLPRPSTDSAPFGWGPPPDNVINRNSPLAANWSVHTHAVPQAWSRNPSRRPSIQHASSSALTTGIASDDDEFLPSSESFAGQASPPPVGVIGTRPVSSYKPPTPRLNPAAPAFQKLGPAFTSKGDKGKGKGKMADAPLWPDDLPPHDTANLSSPAASRKSRDAHSIRTQNSMAESHESLDRATSSTTSEFPSGSSAKDKDGSAFRQLLRKGSSSKFSISFRSKENGLFSGKKGVGSTTNSDRSHGDHRDGSFDEIGEDGALGRSVDSITSSPMIGSMGSGEWKGREKEAGTPKEHRMSVGWGRFTLKRGKGRESSEVERSEAEVTGDEA